MTKPEPTKRLRMFAGPNGSGKSSLIRQLAKEYVADGMFHLNHYINADDILRQLQSDEGFSFTTPGLTVNIELLRESLISGHRIPRSHPFLNSSQIADSVLKAPAEDSDSYIAASIADYCRERFLEAGQSFSFETVMSHSSKVDFPAKARSMGFRTYLYFVALDSPEINRYRVSTRVAEGGHDVPDDKIANRYERSLRFATEVLKHADRAFLFDNSGSSPLLVGERLTNGIFELRVPSAQLPRWFKKYILS